MSEHQPAEISKSNSPERVADILSLSVGDSVALQATEIPETVRADLEKSLGKGTKHFGDVRVNGELLGVYRRVHAGDFERTRDKSFKLKRPEGVTVLVNDKGETASPDSIAGVDVTYDPEQQTITIANSGVSLPIEVVGLKASTLPDEDVVELARRVIE